MPSEFQNIPITIWLSAAIGSITSIAILAVNKGIDAFVNWKNQKTTINHQAIKLALYFENYTHHILAVYSEYEVSIRNNSDIDSKVLKAAYEFREIPTSEVDKLFPTALQMRLIEFPDILKNAKRGDFDQELSIPDEEDLRDFLQYSILILAKYTSSLEKEIRKYFKLPERVFLKPEYNQEAIIESKLQCLDERKLERAKWEQLLLQKSMDS